MRMIGEYGLSQGEQFPRTALDSVITSDIDPATPISGFVAFYYTYLSMSVCAKFWGAEFSTQASWSILCR